MADLSAAEVTEVACEVARYLQRKGIPALLIFHTGEKWQMASAKYPSEVIASALRSVADQAERMGDTTLN